MSEDPNDVTIHANRCLYWLHLCHGINALIDAYTCYCLRPKWPISYLCLGSAFSCLKEHENACMAFLQGLSLDPANKEIQKALQKTMEQKLMNHTLPAQTLYKLLNFFP